MKKDYNTLDLFCGCGGFTKGFEEAGFHSLLGVDIWKDALETYKYNFPNSKTFNIDLSQITTKELLNSNGINEHDIDVIIGGPPCQGFSLSGFRDENDPRNQLYKSFVRTVKDVMPKAFMMENVPGLVKLFDGRAKEAIIKEFSNIGYNVNYEILNASDFGVPQNRKRVFFVGLRKDIFGAGTFFEFPLIMGNRILTCENALSDLPLLEGSLGEDFMEYELPPQNEYQKIMRRNSEGIFNHIATQHKEQTVEIIKLVPDGGNYKSLPEELRQTRKVNIAWTRMNSQKPSFTIDTGHNHHFHYKANRVPTVRESARIQSFPDHFIFKCGKTSQLKQVGNAVPPLLAEVLANALREQLKTIEGEV